MKCFTNTDPNSYNRITVHVDQPIGGTSIPVGPNLDKHFVGHAYLTFDQTTNGVTISRSIGFYPEYNGSPISPSGPPAFNNDSEYSGGWNVKVSFDVSSSQFMAVVNHVIDYGGSNYNLMNRNCGNMCVSALSQIGVNLPTDWMNVPWYTVSNTGSNNNSTVYGPSIGAFGQQIANEFSTNVVPYQISTSGGSAPEKRGGCN